MENIFKFLASILLIGSLSGCFLTAGDDDIGCQRNISLKVRNVSLLEKQLAMRNVHVLQNDDSITLVLSVKDLFTADAANFVSGSSKILDLIFSLSSYYPDSSISITGYVKGNYECGIGKALAMERARKIEHYLWQAGIASNFISADGVTNDFYDSSIREFIADCMVVKISHPVGGI